MSSDVSCPSSSPYLLSVAPVFGHHLPERLQHFDAQTLLVLLHLTTANSNISRADLVDLGYVAPL